MADFHKVIRSMWRGHQQHYASPERKERRKLNKAFGRRQAVQHLKDMRTLEKAWVSHG